MIWKHHKKNGLTMVYGFANETDRKYNAILTLYNNKKKDTTVVYGFLSKHKLSLDDLWALWRTLKQCVLTSYILFEVLPEHAIFYKTMLPVIKAEHSKTFNNLEAEWLKVRIKK